MTVSSQTSNETFDGNGVTTIWPLPFRFFDNGDIRAYLIDTVNQTQTPLVLGTNYTLTGAGLPEQFGTAPGTIVTTTPVATGNKLFVERVMDVEQLTDIINQGKFFPEVHEDVFDKLTMLIQQGVANNNRAIKVPPYDPIPQDLPSIPARADQLMGFNSLGDPIAVAPANGSAADLATRLASTADGNGDSMIGVKQPVSGSASITQHDKNAQTIHINDFPSTPANTWLSRAIDGTPEGWTLQLGAANYIAKFSKARSNITIRGSGMPFYNLSRTALVGFGTTIQGTFGLTGSNVLVEKCGFDSGLNACNALNGGVAMDAFVLNDAARNPLYNCVVRDCIALCKDSVSAAHNFLLEGCVDSRFENLHARYGQWGIVMKTVNSTADGLYAYACSQAGFTFKSDTGVAGAVALRSSVTNLHVFADDYAAGVSPILIYAATSSLADFQLSNFHINGGASGLKLLCDSRAANVNLLNGVTISNGTIRNCTTFGLEAFGAMTDVLVSNVAIIGTTSNKAIKVWSDCLGIELNNVVASSPVVNALNVDLAGRFALNGLYSMVNGDYNSPSGINLVPDSAATFKLGTYLGTIGFSGVQTWTPAFTGLTVVNGTGGVTITGSYVIIGKMIKWRVKIATTGTATTASTASTTFINNLPFLVLQNGSLRAISGTVTQGGVGLVAEGGTNGYTPTWTAYNGTFTIEGEYFFQV